MANDDTPQDDDRRGFTPPRPPERRFGRSHVVRARFQELVGHDAAFGIYYKERVYATFTGLAIVLVVAFAEHRTHGHALLALVLGVAAITVAGFVSEIIAHLAVHRNFPTPREFGVLLRISGGAVATAVIPASLIVLAWLGIVPLLFALYGAAAVYTATLVVIAWFAVRRSELQWWKQLLVLVALVGLGLAVIGIQTLAHGA